MNISAVNIKGEREGEGGERGREGDGEGGVLLTEENFEISKPMFG